MCLSNFPQIFQESLMKDIPESYRYIESAIYKPKVNVYILYHSAVIFFSEDNITIGDWSQNVHPSKQSISAKVGVMKTANFLPLDVHIAKPQSNPFCLPYQMTLSNYI